MSLVEGVGETLMSDVRMPYVAKERPRSVVGPDGKLLTLDDLPPPNTQRWVARRKARVAGSNQSFRLNRVAIGFDVGPRYPLPKSRWISRSPRYRRAPTRPP